MTKLFVTQPLPSGATSKDDCSPKVSKDIFTVFETPKSSVPDSSSPIGLKLVVGKLNEPVKEFIVQDNSFPGLNDDGNEKRSRNNEPAEAMQTFLHQPQIQQLLIVGKKNGDDEKTVKGVLVIDDTEDKIDDKKPDVQKSESLQINVDADAGVPKPTQQTFLETENPTLASANASPLTLDRFKQPIPVLFSPEFVPIDPFRQAIIRGKMQQLLKQVIISRALQEMQNRYIQMNAPVMQQLPPLLPQIMVPQYQVPLQNIAGYQSMQHVPHPLLYFHQFPAANPEYNNAQQQRQHAQQQFQTQQQFQQQPKIQQYTDIQLQPQPQPQSQPQPPLQTQFQQTQQQDIQPMQIVNSTPKKLDSPHQFPLQFEISRHMLLPQQENDMIVDPNLPVEREPPVTTTPQSKENENLNEHDQILKMLQEKTQEIIKAKEKQDTNESSVVSGKVPEIASDQINDGQIKDGVLDEDEMKGVVKEKEENGQVKNDDKVKAVDPIDVKADEQQTAMVIMEDTFPKKSAEAVFEEDNLPATNQDETNPDDTDEKADEDQTSLVLIEDALPQESSDITGESIDERNITDSLSTLFRFTEKEVTNKGRLSTKKKVTNADDVESGKAFKQFFEEAFGKSKENDKQANQEEAPKMTVKPDQVTVHQADSHEGPTTEMKSDSSKKTYEGIKATPEKPLAIDNKTKVTPDTVAETPIIPPI
uniref:DUF4629 domain-containing protein n=1 Tax=Syphacia muris TaxID=451379 RepID=A0A0N5AVK3_9BILA